MAPRGSEKLMRQRTIPKKDLERLKRVLDQDKATELVNWEMFGQPRITEVVGAVRVGADGVGTVAAELARLGFGFSGFPNGIPPLPEEILLSFSSRPGGALRG